VHRRNAAELVIRMVKNHIDAGFCSVLDKKQLSVAPWNMLLPYAKLTLKTSNLLRWLLLNLISSAYAQLHGHFDFNQPHRSSRNPRPCSHEAHQTNNMVAAWSRWLVHWPGA
jgi:hypothetical protein